MSRNSEIPNHWVKEFNMRVTYQGDEYDPELEPAPTIAMISPVWPPRNCEVLKLGEEERRGLLVIEAEPGDIITVCDLRQLKKQKHYPAYYVVDDEGRLFLLGDRYQAYEYAEKQPETLAGATATLRRLRMARAALEDGMESIVDDLSSLFNFKVRCVKMER